MRNIDNLEFVMLIKNKIRDFLEEIDLWKSLSKSRGQKLDDIHKWASENLGEKEFDAIDEIIYRKPDDEYLWRGDQEYD